jgi:hypothetical protein
LLIGPCDPDAFFDCESDERFIVNLREAPNAIIQPVQNPIVGNSSRNVHGQFISAASKPV